MEFLGDYIDGKFIKAKRPDEEWVNYSPSDLSDIGLKTQSCYSHIDQAVEAAREAFKLWSKTTISDRCNLIEKVKEQFLASKEEIAEVISRETGKPIWETRGEAQALVGKIDITIQASLKLVSDQVIPGALAGTKGVIQYKPKGVLLVLGPFNFPAHLPNGHFIPALLTGNTVVFKPSELTPATGQILAKCFDKAGIPKGVFNLVQGGGETGKRLVKHQDIASILFTGSYDTGLRIKQEIVTQYWKSAALEMGGKNTSIVWSDTDLDLAVYQNIFGSFASTGQRCSCTSRIIVHEDIYDSFVERFYQTAKTIKIGHWRDEVFMGPLINGKSVDKFLRFQEIAKREGAENIMRGKAIEPGFKGHYISPSINLIAKPNPKSVYEQEEIFGPNVAIYKTKDLDHAISLANDTQYGLSSAIFTKQESVYKKVAEDLDVGLLNWNRATCGASSKLPFGGSKKSGNGHPSAHFAVYYCTNPVSFLESDDEFDPASVAKGVELK